MNEGRQGEQNETGAETRNLNDVLAYAWAAVSGTVWKTHSLKSSGLLTAEYKRGPLILWASWPGEGEAVQRSGPVASALEDPVDRLNTAQVFERFKRAICGRSKVKRGPNAGRRVGMLLLWRSATKNAKRLITQTANKRRAHALAIMKSMFPGDAFCPGELDAHTRREINESNSIRKRALNAIHTLISSIKHTKRCGLPLVFDSDRDVDRRVLQYALSYAMNFPTTRGLAAIAENVKARVKCRSTFALAVRFLEQEAYRAHLTRRVKPAPRRNRIRRPLYARPQPPAAPLAPPV